jgi:hypothetical protein
MSTGQIGIMQLRHADHLFCVGLELQVKTRRCGGAAAGLRCLRMAAFTGGGWGRTGYPGLRIQLGGHVGGFSGAHSDIRHPEVIWAVAAATTRRRQELGPGPAPPPLAREPGVPRVPMQRGRARG